MKRKTKPYTGPGRRLHPLDAALIISAVICMALIFIGGCASMIGVL